MYVEIHTSRTTKNGQENFKENLSEQIDRLLSIVRVPAFSRSVCRHDAMPIVTPLALFVFNELSLKFMWTCRRLIIHIQNNLLKIAQLEVLG